MLQKFILIMYVDIVLTQFQTKSSINQSIGENHLSLHTCKYPQLLPVSYGLINHKCTSESIKNSLTY